MKKFEFKKDLLKLEKLGKKFKIKFPTIKCKVCGEEILDTPENRLKFKKK